MTTTFYDLTKERVKTGCTLCPDMDSLCASDETRHTECWMKFPERGICPYIDQMGVE